MKSCQHEKFLRLHSGIQKFYFLFFKKLFRYKKIIPERKYIVFFIIIFSQGLRIKNFAQDQTKKKKIPGKIIIVKDLAVDSMSLKILNF